MNSKQILLQACESIPANSRVLLAFSGGSDSSALLHFLHKERVDIQLELAHFNHKLRPESDAEASELSERALNLGLKLYTSERKKPYTANIENEARKDRYTFFDSLEENFDYILTAHHQNDDIESFFLHFLRGSKLAAMRGMKRQRGKILRPLLTVPKQIILDYLEQEKIPYLKDPSNESQQFQRNKIRHSLLPAFFALSPSWQNRWPSQKKYYTQLEDFLQESVERWLAENVLWKGELFSFSRQAFRTLHPFLQGEVLATLYQKTNTYKADSLSLERWQKLIEQGKSSKKTEWTPKKTFLVLRKENISLEKALSHFE